MAQFRHSTHGPWCHAKTYPTHCQYCGQRVFFFSCDCGCKVFFDALGPPWPIHYCVEYAIDQLGVERVQRYMEEQLKTPTGRSLGIELDEGYAAKIQAAQHQPRPQPHQIVRVEPEGRERIQGFGYLREVGGDIDVYEKLSVPVDSVFGMQFLGRLAQGQWAQITLHSGDLSSEDARSYTGLVSSRLLDKVHVKRGELVWFELVVKAIPGLAPVWVCEAIDSVDANTL